MRRLLPALAAAALLLVGCSGSADDGRFQLASPGGLTDFRYAPDERRPIADVEGDSLADPGTEIGLGDYPDQVVVLNVWGSWCGPCRNEADELVAVAAATADDGVRFLGINFRDGDRAAAEDFERDYGVTYPSIYDPSGRTLLALRGVPRSVVPLTVVLDREHRVAAVFLRELLAEDLQPVVEQVAAE